MSDFEKAHKLLMEWENRKTKKGLIVYSNIKEDRGGETACGVARNLYPRLSLWKIVDKVKKEVGLKPLAISDALLANDDFLRQIEEFFYTRFWIALKCDKIPYQPFAENLFLLGVNAGVKRGVRVGQEACGFFGKDIDGIIGKKTIERFINARENETKIFTEIEIRFYKNIVKEKPNQIIFLQGWLNRANAI